MTKLRGLPAIAALAALGAVASFQLVTSGSTQEAFVLTGSSSNKANPSCNGVQNATCNGGSGGDNGGDNGGESVKEFGVSVGSVDGLWPGRTMDLPVTYSNPHAFDIHVSGYVVEAAVPQTSSVACPASYLDVPTGTVTLDPKLAVARKGSQETTIPIGLKPTAPDGCQGVTFDVTVTAWAVKK